MAITSRIVNINAKVTQAATPSQLQQSGAIISLGGTSLTADTYQFTGDLATLNSLLTGSGNSTELGNMASTFFAQGNVVGLSVLELGAQTTVDGAIAALDTWITNNPDIFYAFLCPDSWGITIDEVGSIIINNSGSGYTSAPTITIAAPTSGTTATATATIANGSVIEVTITDPGTGYTSAPAVTFSIPTSGTTATGTANLSAAINVLAGKHASPSAKLYFFITTVTSEVAGYKPNKSVFVTVKSPTAVSTEFQSAAMFYQWLVNLPGAANKLAPMAYRYLYGVTPWAKVGNSISINTILTGYGNVVLTGAEGGISTSAIFKGTLSDGEQAAWWYGIDWFQIQVKQALAAAIINGSNSNPPLLYNQSGINSLQAVAQNVADSAVSFGCALSATVDATPFVTYTTQNPNDYNAGIYNGMSATVVGPSGFLTITFNLDAVQFVV